MSKKEKTEMNEKERADLKRLFGNYVVMAVVGSESDLQRDISREKENDHECGKRRTEEEKPEA